MNKLLPSTSSENCLLYTINPGGVIINTDGISPFKSSSITVWPLLIALSNLPPSIRMNKNNLVTVAVWAGESKPPMEALFEPMIELFDELSTVGLTLKTPMGANTMKFSPLIGLFDMIAKAPVLAMKQFNGKYGCPVCLHPGVHTSSRYYLPGTDFQLRTSNSVQEAGREAELLGRAVDGIKGKSILTGKLDLVKGIPIDYMLEGVTKWLIEKWFGSPGAPYYIGTRIKTVDSNLLLQHPPHDFSRAPRGLKQHKSHWKANEFRNWLLYYSLPLLVSILPDLYLHHYALVQFIFY